jgi:hypothetical protein
MRRWWMWVLGVAACGGPGTFPCAEDAECVADGVQGSCVEPGYCAFEDPDCPSGLRFGAHAGTLSDACVDVDVASATDGSSSGTSEGMSTATSTDPASSQTTASTAEPETSSTTDAGACPPDWWDCAWTHRRPISLTYGGEPLTNFPVYVSLDDGRFDFDVAASEGRDIRFVVGDEVLPHELVIWQPGGATELWVRLPTLAEDASLFLYYGNPDAPSVDAPAEVWSEGYFAVLHLLDESDSLGALALAPFDVEPAPGLVGHALQFDGIGSYLQDGQDPPAPFAVGGTLTVSFHAFGWGQGGFGRLVDTSDINTTVNGYSMAIGEQGDGGAEAVRFGRGYSSNRGTWFSADGSVGLDTWIVASVAHRDVGGEMPGMWIDGAPSAPTTTQVPDGAPVASPLPLTVGALATAGSRWFDGLIDEIHIAEVVRSDAWIHAEYLSLHDQLLVFGPAEQTP